MFFGDATPEDAWDADDDVAVAVDNLARRAVAAGWLDADYDLEDLFDLHDRLGEVVTDQILRRGVLDAQERIRLDCLAADLDTVGQRLLREA